jgi:hypothetical protein
MAPLTSRARQGLRSSVAGHHAEPTSWPRTSSAPLADPSSPPRGPGSSRTRGLSGSGTHATESRCRSGDARVLQVDRGRVQSSQDSESCRRVKSSSGSASSRITDFSGSASSPELRILDQTVASVMFQDARRSAAQHLANSGLRRTPWSPCGRRRSPAVLLHEGEQVCLLSGVIDLRRPQEEDRAEVVEVLAGDGRGSAIVIGFFVISCESVRCRCRTPLTPAPGARS